MNTFVEELTPYLVKKRREFHQYPEVGWTEYVTTYKIATELSALGFSLAIGKEAIRSGERLGVPADSELEEAEERARQFGVPGEFLAKLKGGYTGLAASLDTGKVGKHMTLRFDIDALPIKESKDAQHLPSKEGFASVREGVMHACGHDGHITIGLGVAHYLSQVKNDLSGRFTLIFQPAEEGGKGAKSFVENGWLDGTDYFISGHIGIHSLPVGEIAATTDKFLSSTKINVEYKGKSAHSGLEPNKGKNALLASAAAALHLNGITRHMDGATRINTGKLEAGSGRNIIAEYARMEIETRGETDELNEYMTGEALRIIQASAGIYDVKVDTEIVGTAPIALCNEEWVSIAKEASEKTTTVTNIIPSLPLGASEDVAYMINHVQAQGGSASYLIFCSPLAAGHHHPSFDFDEQVLPTAVEMISRMIELLQSR
ncbi:M20 family metallo-hydrolase [Cytobacillus depressus]|uniref:M20 family metallo-hydrolase n=1 Tax=Cytobacillus depressus TaxID=1602942 RepID=A0A6L3V7G4_9BACI|nr:amidohydrolase [Cytobacillus depressus]KAB2336650.1 M20 family metallo-hydrolase [Cytobacillus depressus]